MPHEQQPGLIPEEREQLEADRQALAELLIEALDTCLKDGSWVPGKGIVGLDDALGENLEREDPPHAA